MAAVVAFHHCCRFNGILADRYGNDPFVWGQPFLWSHCHARSRPESFGTAKIPPYVRGRDAVFFVTHDPRTKRLVCDTVFVIDKVVRIEDVERTFSKFHPVRHYHFDHRPGRNRYHQKSTLTRIADTELSFVLHPPMPIGAWIERHVRPGREKVNDYFQSKRIKNVRIVVHDADGVYRRICRWVRMSGHKTVCGLNFTTLRTTVRPSHPDIANLPIRWPRCQRDQQA